MIYTPSFFQSDATFVLLEYYHRDVYLDWRSVYLPFVFLMADLFTSTLLLINSTSVNGFKVIDSSTSAEFFVAFPFFVSVMFFLSFAATWHLLARCKLSGYEKLLLGVFSIFALPSIFCLERGNFLILCLPLLMLSLTARDKYLIAIALGFLISIKIYFVLLLLMQIANRDGKGIFVCLFVAATLNFFAIFSLGLNFSVDVFLQNLAGFGALEMPFIERWSLNYSFEFLLSSLAQKLVQNFNLHSVFALGLFAIAQLAKLVCLVGLVHRTLSFWRISKSIPSQTIEGSKDLIILIVLFINIYFGEAGGYIGVTLLPIFFYFYMNNKFVEFLALAFCFMPIEFPLISRFSGDASGVLFRDGSFFVSIGLMTLLRASILYLLFLSVCFPHARQSLINRLASRSKFWSSKI